MNNNATINEIIKELESALESVKGIQVNKENSLSELVERAIKDAEVLPPPLGVNKCGVTVDTIDFGEVRIINIRANYGADKRKNDGVGERIEKVTVELLIDIPGDFYVQNLPQKLLYDTAKENKGRLESEIAELEKEINEKRAAFFEVIKIMELNKYE